jgi:RimJ/RimL family protein N-acetyltransferase
MLAPKSIALFGASEQAGTKGLSTELLKLLVQIRREEHLRRITGRTSTENITMKTVSEKSGFNLQFDEAHGEWKAELML